MMTKITLPPQYWSITKPCLGCPILDVASCILDTLYRTNQSPMDNNCFFRQHALNWWHWHQQRASAGNGCQAQSCSQSNTFNLPLFRSPNFHPNLFIPYPLPVAAKWFIDIQLSHWMVGIGVVPFSDPNGCYGWYAIRNILLNKTWRRVHAERCPFDSFSE